MQAEPLRRVLAVHDLSGFGHTSLLAVIPLLNKLGIRVCALPTALLSANTDFPGYRWTDLSAQMEGLIRHWQELELSFDAIGTGFLASERQAELVAEAIHRLRGASTLVLVDPVMGDNGSLYKCFGPAMIPALRSLTALADVVTPNYTEAALLAGADPRSLAEEARILDWCRAIGELGPRRVIVTSVPGRDPQRLEVLYFSVAEDSLARFPFPSDGQPHPGAGDCFSALVLGGLVNGCQAGTAIRAAVQIMSRAIGIGIPPVSDWREGIWLEQVLSWDLRSYYHQD